MIDTDFSKHFKYGSDRMQWSGVISASIKAFEDAPFLTKEQKRDILYNNAARFLKLPGAK